MDNGIERFPFKGWHISMQIVAIHGKPGSCWARASESSSVAHPFLMQISSITWFKCITDGMQIRFGQPRVRTHVARDLGFLMLTPLAHTFRRRQRQPRTCPSWTWFEWFRCRIPCVCLLSVLRRSTCSGFGVVTATDFVVASNRLAFRAALLFMSEAAPSIVYHLHCFPPTQYVNVYCLTIYDCHIVMALDMFLWFWLHFLPLIFLLWSKGNEYG